MVELTEHERVALVDALEQYHVRGLLPADQDALRKRLLGEPADARPSTREWLRRVGQRARHPRLSGAALVRDARGDDDQEVTT